jgi:hypothetical protein
MNGYFLNGLDGEQILVFRSHDHEEIFRIITRLCASRDKEIRALAEKLHIEWVAHDAAQLKENNGTGRLPRKVGPNNGKAGKGGVRGRTNSSTSRQRRAN